jgi:hypothetical protein
MRGRWLAVLATVVALLALPAAAQAWIPSEFIGISPQGATGEDDFELMREAGLKSVRLPLYWSGVEKYDPAIVRPDWSEFDELVTLAASQGLRVFPFLWGTPAWLARAPNVEPTATPRAQREWAAFVTRAVDRYGHDGSFWRANPDLPYLPVHLWEIWNEENIVPFSRRSNPERFSIVLRLGGAAVHRADPGARVILGGLFGRPLQVPPNVASGDFLARIYSIPGMRQYFDGVGLHPYVAVARAMRPQILNLRRVMRLYHDAATPIYVTEMGWGSDGFESRWERGIQGQARELDQAFSLLVSHRLVWRIGGAWWFSWTDSKGCQFCDSAGLLTDEREAKPAWYRFTSWTGGDPRIVPRASYRTLRGD